MALTPSQVCTDMHDTTSTVSISNLTNHMYKGVSDYSAYLENTSDVNKKVQDYKWMVTPAYSVDSSGISIPIPGEFTLFHRNFGRFLANGSNGLETVVNVGDDRVWEFINVTDPIMKAGTYLIRHKQTGLYLDTLGSRPVISTGASSNKMWALESVDDDLVDVFYIRNTASSTYLTAHGNTASTIKVLRSSFLPYINTPSDGKSPTYNFLCQSGYDALYNGPSINSTTVKDCCGSNIDYSSLDQNELAQWREVMDNYPCLQDLPYLGNFTKCNSPKVCAFPPCYTSCDQYNTYFNYAFSGYGKCLDNWQRGVMNNTTRVPCEPYAWFPDLEFRNQFRQIPIPTNIYLQCVDYQRKMINTPQGDGTCPISLPADRGRIGGNPSSAQTFNVSAGDFCVCNCVAFGVDQGKCQGLCSSTTGYNNAADMKQRGVQWSDDARQCQQTQDGNGQFPSVSVCQDAVCASPTGCNAPPPKPGPQPIPDPSVNGWLILLIVIILIALIVGGVILDRMRK